MVVPMIPPLDRDRPGFNPGCEDVCDTSCESDIEGVCGSCCNPEVRVRTDWMGVLGGMMLVVAEAPAGDDVVWDNDDDVSVASLVWLEVLWILVERPLVVLTILSGVVNYVSGTASTMRTHLMDKIFHWEFKIDPPVPDKFKICTWLASKGSLFS